MGKIRYNRNKRHHAGAEGTLTIGYDGKRALRNMTGLGNYSRFALTAIATQFPETRNIVFAAGKPCDRFAEGVGQCDNVTVVGPDSAFDRALPSLWRSTYMARQAADAGVDVFHGLSNELPLTINKIGLPSVVTVHDVIWRRVPGDYTAIDRRLYDFKYGRSARIADRVIAISECTKRDLINDFGIEAAKIDVIYQGIDPSFVPATREAVAALRARYGLPERYIVAVGTVQSRKNQLAAVRALRGLPADIKLAIVGRRTDYARELDRFIASNGLSDRVIWLPSVAFGDLPALYTGAVSSVYMSRYEGFGLPVVESIACGTPVLAATGSCLEEAGGKGALYVAPDDTEEAVDALRRIVDDSYLRTKLGEFGARHIRKFTMANFAKETMTAYRMAILASEL